MTRDSAESLKERLAGLSPEKRALLERRLAERSSPAPAPRITARTSSGPAELSYMQELLWLVQQLDPTSFVYNSPAFRRISGPLDVDAFCRAVDAFVERHDVLRTTFHVVDGRPMQVVRQLDGPSVRIVDLSSVAEGERDEAVQRLIEDEWTRPFDLAADRVLRATLARLHAEEHVFVAVGHHIAWDGWSKGVMYRELSALYGAFAAGLSSPLAPPEIQYADFAEWQRQWLGAGAFDRQLEYWRGKLDGAPTLLELPTDRPRPAVQTHRGLRDSLWMPTELLERLQVRSRELGGTLFMTLLGAFYVLLWRHSGQEDIVVGTPIAGRNRTEVEDLVGYFTNTLALRTDCSGDPTFREFFARVRETALGAFENQDAPLERLIQELRPERDPAYSPIFQVMFALQNFRPREGGTLLPPATLELPGLTVSKVDIPDPKTAKFDFAIGVGAHPEGLHAAFEYNTDLFDKSRVDHVRDQFHTLLEGIAQNPDQRISKLPLLSDADRKRLLEQWAVNGSGVEPSSRLHELVEATARRTPNATAVSFDGESLTYTELEARANRLAHRLRSLGVGPDVSVGVHLKRSLDLPVALLAVLKAGGACLPLDPDYPPERLRFMLEDSRSPVVLTVDQLVEPVAAGAVNVLALDREAVSIAGEPAHPVAHTAEPSDLAYVIYTSGSTGRPRGVELTHAGLAAHAIAAVKAYGLRADDRVLQFSSLSFDISVEELFPSWLAGATVVFRREDVPIFGPDFVEWLRSERITVLDLPTAYWHEWVTDLVRQGTSVPDTLRVLIVGGEKALAGPYRAWLDVSRPEIRWFNTYGPTEASVVASIYEERAREQSEVPGELPIGRPFGSTRLYVLDARGELAPPGVPGELHIGGPGVARGYRNRPELTAEKFVRDPFSQDPDERLYKTGDVVRFGAGGTIEYVGRTDDQIKVRGFRVEPGEIETVLLQRSDVRNAVVVAYEVRPGDKRLVAYVESKGSSPPAPQQLKAFSADRLPAHMTPSAFVVLQAFPLTENGKVDRNALPAPDRSDMQSGEAIPPRDELERTLEGIWQDVLGLEQPVSVNDDFFALGGHSLLAVRLFAEIERVVGVKLPLASMLAGATIEQLATAVRTERGNTRSWSSLVPLRTGGIRPPLFLAPCLDGNVLWYRDLVDKLPDDQPVYGFQSVGLDGRRHPHVSIEQMASHYVQELREFQPDGPYMLGGYCFGGVVAYEMAHNLHEQGNEPVLLALFDAGPMGFERAAQPSRLELERTKFADFLRRDVKGKAAWIARRWRGLVYKVRKKSRWTLFDLLVRVGWPLPRSLQNVELVNARAAATYVTGPSPCKVTVFRTERAPNETYYKLELWKRIAAGGAEIVPIVSQGITHLDVMKEPHVGVLASKLNLSIESSLSRHDVEEVA